MNLTIVFISMIIALVSGMVIGLVISRKESVRVSISAPEIQHYRNQFIEPAQIAHGGGPLIPDKPVYEIIREGAENNPLVFPKIDF